MGPPDRESWLLTNLYPSGHARGWRRVGCLVMLWIPLVVLVIVLIAEVR
jgi:hypothetical protein